MHATISHSVTLSYATLSRSVTLSYATISRSVTLSYATIHHSVTLSYATISRSVTLSYATISYSVTLSYATVSRSVTLSFNASPILVILAPGEEVATASFGKCLCDPVRNDTHDLSHRKQTSPSYLFHVLLNKSLYAQQRPAKIGVQWCIKHGRMCG